MTFVSTPAVTQKGSSSTVSYLSVSSTLSLGLASNGLNPTGVVSDGAPAPKESFLKNKGAMAGVFTVVALVGVGIILAIINYAMIRRARRRDEEDTVHFEKFRDPEPRRQDPFSPTPDHLGQHDSAENFATVAAAPDAYPDRSVHYGSNMAGTGAQYAETQYAGGLEYPPGTAYASAASQQGQYQYGGLAPGSQPEYNAQARTSPTHPFADPHNRARPGMAPPVTQGYQPESAYLGDAAAYAQ